MDLSGESSAGEEEIHDEDDVPFEEEADDGEDLMGEGFEADYQVDPRLDTYETGDGMIDDRRIKPMSRDQLQAAERAMRQRDQGGGRRGGLNLEEEEDDMEEDEEFHSKKRKRRREKERWEDEEAPDGDDEDFDLTHEDEPTVIDERLERKISAAFRRFLQTFRLPNSDKNKRPFYLQRLDQLTRDADSQLSLVVNVNDHMTYEGEENEFGFILQLPAWLTEHPRSILAILDRSLAELMKKMYNNFFDQNPDVEVKVRVENLSLSDSLRGLRTAMIGKLVQVTGVVTRRTGVHPQLRRVVMACVKCSAQTDPIDTYNSDEPIRPGKCATCQQPGPFILDKELTVFRNFQRVTIQETPGSMPPGRVPRSKEAILTGDLVDSVKPGDEVELIGIYANVRDALLNAKSGFPIFSTFIEANCIRRMNESRLASLTDDDVDTIRALSKEKNIRERILKSIAPSIYGEKHMKTAIAYSMFGGVPKLSSGGHRIRGDINVLLLGDPGVAKSQILKYVEKTFYRTVFATGKGASAVGLTASVRRDPLTGEWTLEGGALVLADNGMCLIDEFDKMGDKDRTSIHEAMEQQSISVSKAGIVTSLQARCAVIAAANPIHGRYNSSVTFAENTDLGDPILSRFDCLAVVRDEVDPIKDERLAEFVCCSHMRSHPEQPNESAIPRYVKMEAVAEQEIKPLEQKLLQKYILFAREHCKPKATSINSDKLAKFYSEVREEAQHAGGIQMTVRHVESMLRMAEANARIELRDIVMEKDIDFAIASMLESFVQSQKHQVAERMMRKFSKYVRSVSDHNELLVYLLQKLFSRAVTIQQQMHRQKAHVSHNDADDFDFASVFIQSREFEQAASQRGLHDTDPFFKSAEFISKFMLTDNGRKIQERPMDE
eukprot:GHVL01006361.1.p1 GENE.GHVL01006361.1~~GHVL01006361.1.p1  ORF type:complete len:890 (+),score=173.34 GHVL01006361.1:21-2690(+)